MRNHRDRYPFHRIALPQSRPVRSVKPAQRASVVACVLVAVGAAIAWAFGR